MTKTARALVFALSCAMAGTLATPGAGAQVWVERINRYDDKMQPIPGDGGMSFFHGTWIPRGQSNADIFKTMTIRRDGRIAYDYWVKPSDERELSHEYKPVATDGRTMLLVVKYWNPLVDRFVHDFWALTLQLHTEADSMWLKLVQYSCVDERFGEAEWQMPAEEIWAFFKKSFRCEPKLTKSTARYPWTGWSEGVFNRDWSAQ